MLSKYEPFVVGLREVLIEHMDGKIVPFDALPHTTRRRTLGILVTGGYLRSVGNVFPPKATQITDRGRGALSDLLADYADCLERAGYYDDANDRSGHIPPGIPRNRDAETMAGPVPPSTT